jgi:hypothetical protein
MIPEDERKALVKKQLESSLSDLAMLGGLANHVSITQTGLPTTVAGDLASRVFAKMCAHARSIAAITQSSMFDHHAIMTLARMIIDSSVMLAYLDQEVSDEEWQLRHAVLRLHDTSARIKLLRGYGNETDDLRKGRESIKAEIRGYEAFRKLPDDRREKLLTGDQIFVRGMRHAAVEFGWEESRFGSIYGYLSDHVHSTPMSFMRMKEHEIDYYFPGEAQHSTAVLAIELSAACLRRSIMRQIDKHPEQLDKYHPEIVAEVRESDKSGKLFS